MLHHFLLIKRPIREKRKNNVHKKKEKQQHTISRLIIG